MYALERRSNGRRQVAHNWAHAVCKRGDSTPRGRASNLFYEGDTIYSYGHHFPIARYFDHKGTRYCFLTTRSYSSSTQQHISLVRQAIPDDWTIIHVYNPLADYPAGHKKNWEAIVSKRDQQLEVAGNTRKRAGTRLEAYRRAVELQNQADEYRNLFCSKRDVKLLKPLPPAETALPTLAAKAKEDEEKRKAAEARREARELQQAQEKLAEWLQGKDTYPGSRVPVHFRLRSVANLCDITEAEVETTLGARFPRSHAERAFKFLLAIRQRGETYQRNGHSLHVGNFVVDSMDANGTVRAGCHTVQWEQIEQFAKQLGLL